MQFGIREICDVVFKAKTAGKMGTLEYVPGQPVLYIDSAKTSTIEGASTTVYATGGKGNSRLISWEGEKTLTFTVEDAMLSELGFAILSGAQLFNANGDGANAHTAYVHTTATAVVNNGTINLAEELAEQFGENANAVIDDNSPVFILSMDHGSLGEKINGTVDTDRNAITVNADYNNKTVFVDFYVARQEAVTEMIIDAENFAGYYYVEASTLFRRQDDGKDLPAEIIFPNVKIQSNFTFTMASSGDPSTFTFTMDAMPGYTRFKRDKKVLCAIQVIEDTVASASEQKKDSTETVADMEKAYPVENDNKVLITYKAAGFGNVLKTEWVEMNKEHTLAYAVEGYTATFTGTGAAGGKVTPTANIEVIVTLAVKDAE